MRHKKTLDNVATAFRAAVLAGLAASAVPLLAGVPLVWEVTPQRPAPAPFDRFHGESLDFRCAFTGFGATPFAEGSDVRLWYQTNGMGAAWWSLPATVSATVVTNGAPGGRALPGALGDRALPATNYTLSATFPPSADPGAERLTVFFGAPSNAYTAALVRFRNSPGAMPNNLEPPSVLDWRAELSAATNEVPFIISNTVTAAYIEGLGINAGLTTNDVCAIVTNTYTVTVPVTLDALWLDSGGAGDYSTEAAVIDPAARTVSWAVGGGGEGWAVVWNFADGTLYDPAAGTTTEGITEMPLGGYWGSGSWTPDYVDVGSISYETSTQTVTFVGSSLGLARMEDIPKDHVTRDELVSNVCNIVTNEVEESRWTFVPDIPDYCKPMTYHEGFWTLQNGMGLKSGREDDETVSFGENDSGLFYAFTATRQSITRNALGFARMEDLPSTNGMVTAAGVTNTVRAVAYAVNDYVWDGDVCWRRQMLQGGYLEFVAVTNIDVTLPENHEALEALERARRNQE